MMRRAKDFSRATLRPLNESDWTGIGKAVHAAGEFAESFNVKKIL